MKISDIKNILAEQNGKIIDEPNWEDDFLMRTIVVRGIEKIDFKNIGIHWTSDHSYVHQPSPLLENCEGEEIQQEQGVMNG